MKDLDPALDALEHGRVVAAATDTLMGLLVAFDDADALRRLAEVKARPKSMAVALIAADAEMAFTVLRASTSAEAWAKHWPGPVTLVGSPVRDLDERLMVHGKVGVRVPRPCDARLLAKHLGRCVTATSANVHGEPPVASSAELSVNLVRRVTAGDGVVLSGAGPGGEPSALVDVETGRVIRAGHGIS
ncbi:MAG: Sua5/YciO/YrdC/YwlC family protein [Myxococcota bacterium]